jgi:hypothetical protein
MLTLPTTPRCPHVASRPARRRPVAVVARLLAVIPLGLAASTSAWGGLPVTLAQVSLTELQATQQARQQMEAGAADAAGRVQMSDEDASVEPGDAAAGGEIAAGAPATEGSGGGGMLKYLPTYGLLILFAGLGTFAACRPVRRTAPDGT